MMKLVRLTPYADASQTAYGPAYPWFDAAQRAMQREGVPDAMLRPAMDVIENDNGYVVRVDLPGLSAEDVHVDVEDFVLTIRGEIAPQSAEEENVRYHYRERRSGTFQRTLRLPETVDVAHIEAAFEHGVLTLTLPLVPETQPKRIKVEVA